MSRKGNHGFVHTMFDKQSPKMGLSFSNFGMEGKAILGCTVPGPLKWD